MDNLELARALAKYPLYVNDHQVIKCDNGCHGGAEEFLEGVPTRRVDFELVVDALVSHINNYHPEFW